MIAINHVVTPTQANQLPYPPKISPPPPFSALDMAQTGEGAYFRICATRLEYNISPPLADSLTRLTSFSPPIYNTRIAIYRVYSRFEPRTHQ